MIETLEHHEHDPPALSRNQGRYAELLIVDEADRLKTPTWSNCATGTTAPASA